MTQSRYIWKNNFLSSEFSYPCFGFRDETL